VTPVTPVKFWASQLQAPSTVACDAVTPVTPYMRGRTHAHARTGIRVSYMSQRLYNLRIKELNL
jgi:hypothetical protein